MEVNLKVKINAGDIYDYLLYFNYTSMVGVVGNTIGALMVVFAFMQGKWIFLIMGAVILLYLPWTLFIRSRQQALNNPAFKQEMTYSLTEEGLTVILGEEQQMQKWTEMFKAVSTPRSIIVYTTRNNATIIPRRSMGESQMKVIEIISTHMSHKKVKIRT